MTPEDMLRMLHKRFSNVRITMRLVWGPSGIPHSPDAKPSVPCYGLVISNRDRKTGLSPNGNAWHYSSESLEGVAPLIRQAWSLFDVNIAD